MIFVDTNVFMFAVGGPHPLRGPARAFFQEASEKNRQLVTSAEVLQELMHAYLPVGRVETLDAALTLADSCIPVVWPIEAEDVRAARLLADRHSGLGARDLLHLACCRRHDAEQIKTFDRGPGGSLRYAMSSAAFPADCTRARATPPASSARSAREGR